MSKPSKIKWRKTDKQRLSRAVQQFNAKLTRLSKKHPELEPFLPKRIAVAEIRDKITTRQDFNREVKSLERFKRKGAESPVLSKSGVMTTKWEKLEIGYKVREINRRRKIELERANVSTYKGTMGSIKANNLLPKPYDINKIKPSDWGKFVESVEKQIRSSYHGEKIERYKHNYIVAIHNNLPEPYASNLIRIVNNISSEWLYDAYYQDPVLQIDFAYDPLDASLIYESIINRLSDYGYPVDKWVGNEVHI